MAKTRQMNWYELRGIKQKRAATFGVDANGHVWFPASCIGGVLAIAWIGCSMVSGPHRQAYVRADDVRKDKADDAEFLAAVDKIEASVLEEWRKEMAGEPAQPV